MDEFDETIPVTSPLLPDLDEFHGMLKEIWKSKWITNNGNFHKQLEKKLAEYLKVPYLSLFTNGTLPLITALQALHITGEVITTPYSFVATTHALWWNGIKPVFVDIDLATGNMDPEKIEAAITPRTTAIMPVHVYGKPCNTEAIQEIADKYGLKIIYDAAHAFGETYKGENVARFGDMSMFSFHATKVFNTVEGGCLTFADDSKVQYINGLRQFGQVVGTEKTPYIGTNAKMTEMHAAMGLCNLRHIKEYIENRKKITERYRERLEGVQGIRLCPIQQNVEFNYAYFPVVFEKNLNRDEIMDKLSKNEIYARKYFYPLTREFESCKQMGINADTPIAKYVSDRVLTLPCYSDLGMEDVDRICDIILN